MGKIVSVKTIAASAAILFSAVAGGGAAQAATIVYTISGNGSGSLAGSSFSNANYSFTLTGDDSNITESTPVAPFQVLNPLSSATFQIDGTGGGSFSIPTRLGFNVDNNAVFFSRASGNDIFDFYVGAPLDLTSSFSVTSTGLYPFSQFLGLATSAGALTFTGSSQVSFSNQIGGSTNPPLPGGVTGVPEPANWAMMIAGFGLVGGAMRTRKLKPVAIG